MPDSEHRHHISGLIDERHHHLLDLPGPGGSNLPGGGILVVAKLVTLFHPDLPVPSQIRSPWPPLSYCGCSRKKQTCRCEQGSNEPLKVKSL